jgi:hypothetical protein
MKELLCYEAGAAALLLGATRAGAGAEDEGAGADKGVEVEGVGTGANTGEGDIAGVTFTRLAIGGGKYSGPY